MHYPTLSEETAIILAFITHIILNYQVQIYSNKLNKEKKTALMTYQYLKR